MYVRSKVVKGEVYYQVVHGYRDEAGKVKHRHLVSLGRQPTIGEALESEMQGVANLREERAKLGEGPLTGRLARRAGGLDRMIDEGAKRIAILTELAKGEGAAS